MQEALLYTRRGSSLDNKYILFILNPYNKIFAVIRQIIYILNFI